MASSRDKIPRFMPGLVLSGLSAQTLASNMGFGTRWFAGSSSLMRYIRFATHGVTGRIAALNNFCLEQALWPACHQGSAKV